MRLMRYSSFPGMARFAQAIHAAGIALLLLCLAQPAQAALIELDSSFGANTVTRDTDTGLDWLDLTISEGTLPETDARLAAGGDLFGWRRATTAEVMTFWTHAGITPTGSGNTAVLSSDPALAAAIAALMDNIGLSIGGGGSIDNSYGYTAEAGSSPGMWTGAWLLRKYDVDVEAYTQGAAMIWAELEAVPFHTGDVLYSSWLVREYRVPEPSALLLLAGGAAIMGLGQFRRRAR